MKKGTGIFVRNDINGNPIRVGDIVKVTRPEMSFLSINYEEQSWTGDVRLLLSKGIVVRSEGQYIKAPIADKSRNIWTWELIQSFEHPKCQCKKPKFSRNVNENFNPLCGNCGKLI